MVSARYFQNAAIKGLVSELKVMAANRSKQMHLYLIIQMQMRYAKHGAWSSSIGRSSPPSQDT
ncbi:hypothetical protein CYK37_22420 [Mesorhizobium loti]|nr:hypothetical protein CYK37_22420 [Mesorhizobium loti]